MLPNLAGSELELLNALPDAVLLVRRNGAIAFANGQAAALFGYTRGELLGLSLETLVPEPFRASHESHRESFFGDPVVRPMGTGLRLNGLRQNGTEFPADIGLAAIELGDESLAVCSVRDLTKRVQAEDELRSSQELASIAMDAVGNHVAVLDRQGTILEVNEAWKRFAQHNGAGSDASVVSGANYLEVCRTAAANGSAEATAALNGIVSVLEGRQESFETTYDCHAPDEQRWFLMFVNSLNRAAGGALITHVNITGEKQLEANLEAALAEVGRLRDRLEAENADLRERLGTVDTYREIAGDSPPLKAVLHQVELVAPTDSAVLLMGETGTGKGLLAQAIHSRSGRAERAFVKVNCAALPATLIESELFGHEKGAFTGATARRLGRLEMADGGTIFLDEIGDLPLEHQSKLLRVLQDGEFERVGSTTTIKVDVRVVGATNRNLKRAMTEGRFRTDLYYRLNVFPIALPPLRERKEDIPILVWFFATRLGPRLGKRIEQISHETMDALLAYDWPGNVRELEHVVERAMILSPGSALVVEDLAPKTVPAGPATAEDTTRIPQVPGPRSLEQVERAHIINTLELCGWKVKGAGNAAERLGLSESTVRYRMKKLRIARP